MPRKPADFTIKPDEIDQISQKVRDVRRERTRRYSGMLDLHLSDMLKTYRALLDGIEELGERGTAKLAKIEAEFSEIEAQASPKERQRYAPFFQEFEAIKRRIQ